MEEPHPAEVYTLSELELRIARASGYSMRCEFRRKIEQKEFHLRIAFLLSVAVILSYLIITASTK